MIDAGNKNGGNTTLYGRVNNMLLQRTEGSRYCDDGSEKSCQGGVDLLQRAGETPIDRRKVLAEPIEHSSYTRNELRARCWTK